MELFYKNKKEKPDILKLEYKQMKLIRFDNAKQSESNTKDGMHVLITPNPINLAADLHPTQNQMPKAQSSSLIT